MILLDTNAVIWAVDGSPRLGEAARDLIETHHPVYYSAISVQEMTIKAMKGRLVVPDPICVALDDVGLRQLPFVGEHAEAIRDFSSLVSHDPFDRALVAQAKAEGLKFLTADRVLLGLGHSWIVDAEE